MAVDELCRLGGREVSRMNDTARERAVRNRIAALLKAPRRRIGVQLFAEESGLWSWVVIDVPLTWLPTSAVGELVALLSGLAPGSGPGASAVVYQPKTPGYPRDQWAGWDVALLLESGRQSPA